MWFKFEQPFHSPSPVDGAVQAISSLSRQPLHLNCCKLPRGKIKHASRGCTSVKASMEHCTGSGAHHDRGPTTSANSVRWPDTEAQFGLTTFHAAGQFRVPPFCKTERAPFPSVRLRSHLSAQQLDIITFHYYYMEFHYYYMEK